MKYMLLCYDDEPAWQAAGQAVHQQAMNEAAGLCREMAEKGQYLLAAPLQPVATATSVRVRDGKRSSDAKSENRVTSEWNCRRTVPVGP